MDESESTSNPAVQVWIGEARDILKDYPGHATPEERRACDEALRAYLVEVVSDFLNQVGTLEVYLRHAGRGEELREKAQEAEQRIDSLLDKIQSAPYAFSPFFTADHMAEEPQDTIVGEDRAVIFAAQRVRAVLEPTLAPDSDMDSLLESVMGALAELDQRIEARVSTIIEFQG